MKNLNNLPATQQMDINQLQSLVALEKAADIAVVESVEALTHLSGVKIATVIGYNSGSTKGGGTYIRQPGTGGLRVGEWLFQPGQTVTPHHFGAIDGSWDEDSYDALDAFFTFCGTRESRDYAVYAGGAFGTSNTLLVDGLSGIYSFDLSIKALAPMNDVMVARNCDKSRWTGKIVFACSAHPWLRRRTGVNGLRIEGGREAHFCDIEAYRGSGWAVYYAAGNNNMSSIGRITASDMGASTRDDTQSHKVTAVGYVNRELNTLWQNTTIQLSENSVIPSEAHQLQRSFWISAAKEPYKILSVNRENNTITVYPMIPDAEQTLDAQHLVFGGGICNYAGGHTAKGRIGHVSTMRSGIGLWITGQSTCNVDGHTGQSNAIDIVMGSNPQNVFGGGFIGSIYSEWSRIADLIFTSQTSSQYSYGSIFGSCTNLDFSKWFSLDYKRTNTLPRRGGKQYFPITFMNGGHLWSPVGDEVSMHDRTTYTGSTRSSLPHLGRPLRNNTEIFLSHDRSSEVFKGRQPVTFYLYGTRGRNGSYHQEIPIRCGKDYTINGKAGPIMFPNTDAPVTIYAVLEDGANWRVTYTEHQVL
jgi:hypothetical protein